MFKCFKNTLHIDFRHSNKQWIVENRLVLLPSGTVRRLYVLLASSFKEKLFLFMVLYWLFVPSKRNNHEPHSIRNKHKNTGEAVALVSFVDFCFFPMLCKVVVHGLVVQWVRVCYLLVSTLEAVRSRQGEGILIWLPVIYLPSFLEEDFFFSIFQPLQTEIKASFWRNTFTKQNRHLTSHIKSITEKHWAVLVGTSLGRKPPQKSYSCLNL